MDPGFLETRRPHQSDRLTSRNYPDIAIATTIKDGNGKALFTGVTEIYEPEAQSKESR